MRSYFIETWGCQMNVHDSERLEGQLLSLGLGPSPSAEEADLVLLNTCSVREKAAQKIINRIGELGRLPEPPVVGVCGCVGEQEGEALLARSGAVGFVLGPGQISRLGDALVAASAGQRLALIGFGTDSGHHPGPVARRRSTRAMVTVIEGCAQHCTFCVVPYTRGPEVSRPADDVLAEVRSLVSTGAREVELLGQTINAYRCPIRQSGFAELLTAVAEIPGLERLRFVTSHPRFFDDALIEAIARHPNVSRYLHLPVQAGSDRTLRRMARRYTRDQYLDLVNRIRSRIPDVNLTTDVIVGFPGESDEDFEATLDLLARVRFGQVFGFIYSSRPRTPAGRLEDHVPEPVSRSRLNHLFALTDSICAELNAALIGRILPVLIHGTSRRSPSDWQGRAEDNRVVNLPRCRGEQVGDIVDVLITRAGAHSLVGEISQEGIDANGVGEGTALTSLTRTARADTLEI